MLTATTRTAGAARWFALLALASLLQVGTLPAFAAARCSDAARATAIAAFTKGKVALKAEDFDGALRFFRDAQAACPHEPLIILALAKTLDRARETEDARKYYRLFLKEAPAEEKERPFAAARVKELTAELATRPGRIRLTGVPSQATVKVDGADAALDGKSVVEVAAGDHELLVEMRGRLPWKRAVAVHPGEQVSVEVVLVEPVDERKLPRDYTWTWISGGTTAAVLVGAGVVGVMAVNARSDYFSLVESDGRLKKSTVDAYGCANISDCSEGKAAANKRRNKLIRRTNWALGLSATGAGLGIATILLYFTAPTDKSAADKAARSEARWQPTWVPGPTGLASAGLRWRF